MIRQRCISRWRQRWIRCWTRLASDSENAARERQGMDSRRGPRWPMIVLRTPKGWTGPKMVDGKPVEGQVAGASGADGQYGTNPGHLKILEEWMKSYRPEELFDAYGTLMAELAELAPKVSGGWARIRTRTAGCCCSDLRMPDFRTYAVDVPSTGAVGRGSHSRTGEVLA